MSISRGTKKNDADRKAGEDLRLYAPDELPAPSSVRDDEPSIPRLPVVLPAPETVGPFDRDRLRKVLIGTVGVAALCLLAFLLRSGGKDAGPARTGLELGTRDAAAAPASPSGDRGPGAALAAMPSDSAAGAFDRRSDALAAALERYGVRARDFENGLIGCEELASGYRLADSSFVALSELVGKTGTALDSDRVERYRELADRASGVDRAFGATKCPRPR